ncbi:hemerythrin domain-containing protein [Streptomyces sp. NPDC001034]|uniref:hemerythrin domain-containing protein n=1 Tax=Streptomyces sp. NPDC001034 TaxID=3154375 RepID=UPI003329456A
MGHGGNVVQELTTDHREVEQLFGRIEALPPGSPQRRELADEVTIELVRHSVAEEAYLYPAVREHLDGGDALADKEIEDHAQAEQIMKDLEGLPPDDPRFDTLMARLTSEIRSHLADEERDLFPKLEAACAADALTDLGDKVRRAKKTAPTRPHPSAPDAPWANKLLAPGTGLVDRMRDALSGRGKGN